MSSILRTIQDECAERIRNAAFFTRSSAKVRTRSDEAIETKIAEALKTLGLTVFIFPPEPQSSKPNMPGPHFDKVEISVRIFENPVVNKTGIDAWEAWEEIASERGLHRFKPRSLAAHGALHIAERPFTDVSDDFPGLRAFDANFTAACNLIPIPK